MFVEAAATRLWKETPAKSASTTMTNKVHPTTKMEPHPKLLPTTTADKSNNKNYRRMIPNKFNNNNNSNHQTNSQPPRWVEPVPRHLEPHARTQE